MKPNKNKTNKHNSLFKMHSGTYRQKRRWNMIFHEKECEVWTDLPSDRSCFNVTFFTVL